MGQEQADISLDIRVINKVMDRWRVRLLTHGAASDLGMEAKRQLIKLEARKELLSSKEAQEGRKRAPRAPLGLDF